MNYCIKCGNRLKLKELKNEGLIPYCDKCMEYRFHIFSTAVILIIINSKTNQALLVKQYNTNKYRLIAGYINKGESAEEALVREMKEEIGIKPISYIPLQTMYFEKSNTLMLNYLVYVDELEINANEEIDEYAWFNIDDAYNNLIDAKLAYKFFGDFITKKIH